MVVQVELDPKAADDLAKLTKKLKTLGDGKQIPKEFRAALRQQVQPIVAQAKSAARSIPSSQTERTRPSLRAAIARAITAKVKLGADPNIGVRISSKALGDRGTLPRLLNRSGGWTHPVFGHPPVVTQQGTPGWYDDVMRAAVPDVRKELERVCKEFERKLMG